MIADVGGEIDPDTGLPAYREVVAYVPRQSGKTTLFLSWNVQRALGWGSPQRIVYTAQTGLDARKKLIEDQVPILEPRRAKLGIRRILKGMGQEAVEFFNGSRIVLMASGTDAGHGKTVDLGNKDEFFADTDDRRDQALVPAMATRPAAQLLTASTAGTDESVPLNKLVERGRRAVTSGDTTGIAFFEWSADPDSDFDDPAVWRTCMPALGHTITEDVVRQARGTLSTGEFGRGFMNIPTRSDERLIPATVWDLVCDPHVKPVGSASFALDANPERSAACLSACGGGVVEVISHQPRLAWVIPRVREKPELRRGPWAIDPAGPAASLIPDLRAEGIEVIEVGGRELAAACGAFFDRIVDTTKPWVRRHPSLDEATAGVAKRASGDAFTWARRSSDADICPLFSVTLAHWIDAHSPGGEILF